MNLVWLVKANSKLLKCPFYASRKTLKLSDPTWLNDTVCFEKKVTRKTFSYHTIPVFTVLVGENFVLQGKL